MQGAIGPTYTLLGNLGAEDGHQSVILIYSLRLLYLLLDFWFQ